VQISSNLLKRSDGQTLSKQDQLWNPSNLFELNIS
jgi:hypothetical protein